MNQMSLQRYDGAVSLEVGPEGLARGITAYRQTPPMRLFRPHREPGEPDTVAIGNIAGGVAGGDKLSTHLSVDGNALLALTQAAEKVYRTPGPTAVMELDLAARSGGTLEWLSSGTILFDGSALDRTTTLSAKAGGSVLFVEIVMFGRSARGERFETGALRDRIRVEVDGKLTWLDDLALGPDPLYQLENPAGFGGASALATIIMLGRDGAAARDLLREVSSEPGTRTGVVAFEDGLLVARVLGERADAVRRVTEAYCRTLRSELFGRPAKMPILWSV